MLKQKSLLLTVLLAGLLVLGLTGCGGQSSQVDIDMAVTQTLQALAAGSGGGGDTSDGEAQPQPAATEAPATQEPVVPPTPTATVAHVTIPSGPGGVASFMTDRSSAALASERRAIADNYTTNLLERPFTSQAMDYKGYVDITRAELSMNPPFVYVTIQLEGSPPAGTAVEYGVEVDLDLDGRGDWLITGQAPPDTNWTTDGVRACRDANHDVGGPTPMREDAPNPSRDGYEDCVFDSGYGLGPDEAWIRRDPSNANYIQLAFMHSLIGSDGEFLWGAWADEGLREPGWYDYQDHFTGVEAGSPASNSSEYPLKAVALLDNTCRWGYGFTPTGSEPGACYVPPTPTPVLPGSISGLVWLDTDYNNTRTAADHGIAGVTVTLKAGSCGGAVVATTTTGPDGSYSFSGVTPGNYCVSVGLTCGPCSGHCATSGTTNPRQVTVTNGTNTGGVDFGFYLQGPC